MANTYCQFSFKPFEKLTQAEKDWLNRRSKEFIESDEPPGFIIEVKDSCIVYTEESGDPDIAAELCKNFLARFRLDSTVWFEYANFCSAPRVGQFGGGGYVVTAKDTFIMSPVAMMEMFLKNDLS